MAARRRSVTRGAGVRQRAQHSVTMVAAAMAVKRGYRGDEAMPPECTRGTRFRDSAPRAWRRTAPTLRHERRRVTRETEPTGRSNPDHYPPIPRPRPVGCRPGIGAGEVRTRGRNGICSGIVAAERVFQNSCVPVLALAKGKCEEEGKVESAGGRIMCASACASVVQ